MNDPVPSAPSGGFDLNHATIVSLLYVASYITGVTAIIGVVLCYVWRDEARGTWEESHLQYLANTFWIGLAGGVLGLLLAIVLIGFLIWVAVAVLCLVRIILSLINAQKREPMPNPSSFLV